MRILIPATEDIGGDAKISNRFGRSKYLAIYEGEKYQIIKNDATRAIGGAGVQTAQYVVNEKIDVLIAKDIGPKAWQVLNAADIEIYEAITASLDENIKAFQEDKLTKISSATNAGGRYK